MFPYLLWKPNFHLNLNNINEEVDYEALPCEMNAGAE
jgi:hypothetical protein